MGVDTGCGQSAFPAGGGGGTVPPLIPTAMPRSAVPPERRLHQQPLQRGLQLRHQPRQRQGHLHLPLGLHGAGLQPGCGRVLAGYGQPGAGEPVGNSPMGVGGSDGGGRHTPNCSRGQGSQSSPSPVLHPPPPPPPGANPCEHAGKCINTLGSFECQCLQGYTGPRCEIDVNECVSNPCQNDATCLDQIGEFQCICMPGTRPAARLTLGVGKPHRLCPWPPCPPRPQTPPRLSGET